MAGFDIDLQHSGFLKGSGVMLEMGEYTMTGGTVDVPTRLTTLWGGLCVGELTDHCSGYASSICEGPTVHYILSDGTVTTVNYFHWGF